MLKQLRLRMAAANIAMTGLVFAALMLVMTGLSESMYRQTRAAGFQNDVNGMVAVVRASASVSGSWLARTEAGNRYVIAVETGGAPFAFRGAWEPPTGRETLLSLAREAPAREAARDDGSLWKEATVKGDRGEPYRCLRVSFPVNGVETVLTVLGDLTGEQALLVGRRWMYAAISAAVLAALCLIGWYIAGKAVRPAAESMQKQKEFIAAASHELRTPLAVIGTSVSALRMKPEKGQRLMDNIEAECGQMARLIEDMLLLANLDANSWPLEMAEVELDTVLIGAAEKYGALAAEKGFALRLELPEELIPPVWGDGQRLSQVVGILVGNAAEYAGKGGEIVLEAAPTAQGVRIDVIDHGVGIPAEERERVFDRFYRGDKSRTGKKHFGLGLAIAAELVRLHGGTLEALETPGGGCTFRILLHCARKA